MWRSVGAVLAGLVAVMLIVIAGTLISVAVSGAAKGEPTRGYLVLNLAVSALGAILGGAVVAWLAPRRPWAHVAALAALMILLALPGLSGAPGQPAFYPLGVLSVGLLGVVLGAAIVPRDGTPP